VHDFQKMPSPKFEPVAFVNSDIIIKAFVDDDKPTLTKLLNISKKMNVEEGQKFLITEFVINDVVTEAHKKGISKNKIFKYMFPGKTIYFQTVSVPSHILQPAVYLLDEGPDDVKLTLTDWTGLLMMVEWNIDTIISDKIEIDKVIHDSDLHTIFKQGIKRI